MKLQPFLLLFALGGLSMPSCALPPVVNNQGNLTPAPSTVNVPKQPPSNTLYEIMNRLEQLQSEVQQLTGKVEEQAYENAELKKRLSTMYSDFDERMQSVESKLGGASQIETESPAEQGRSESSQPAQDAPETTQPSQGIPAESQEPQSQSASPPAATQESQATPEAENQEYRQAYDALRNGRTTQSIEAFNAFLRNYPSSQLAGNAQYWLGEAHRVNQDSDAARKAFNKVIDNYPNSAKVPDALLKLGYIEIDLNNGAKAREYLTRVASDYPKSTAARLAEKKLPHIEEARP